MTCIRPMALAVDKAMALPPDSMRITSRIQDCGMPKRSDASLMCGAHWSIDCVLATGMATTCGMMAGAEGAATVARGMLTTCGACARAGVAASKAASMMKGPWRGVMGAICRLAGGIRLELLPHSHPAVAHASNPAQAIRRGP